MDAARRKARNEWYARLKETDETLWCLAENKKGFLEMEAASLPLKERLTISERADIVDAITGCGEDPDYLDSIKECKRVMNEKRNHTLLMKKRSREEIIREETRRAINGGSHDASAGRNKEPTDAGASMGEKSPGEPSSSGGSLPPPVVGDPRDVLWAMENLGNDRVMRAAAPSGIAWTLVAAGRKNPDTLIRLYQQVCIPNKKDLEDSADEAESFDNLDDVLKRVVAIAGECNG